MSDLIGSMFGGGSGDFKINCFSRITPACKDLNIPWGEDWTF